MVSAVQESGRRLRTFLADRPLMIMMLAASAWGGTASIWACANHRNFGTTLFDLAVYDNVMWQTLHGRLLGTSLISNGSHTGTHFDPILIALTPLYAIWPRAESLLIMQAIWLAFGSLPLFLIARRTLGNGWQALALGAALLFYPGLHGPTFYDFHSLSLAGPLLLWALFFLDSGQQRKYVVTLVLLLLTREDMALLMVPVGICAFFRGDKEMGRLTIAGSLLYFAIVKLALQLWAGGGGSFAYYYSDLVTDPEGGLGHLIISIVAHPVRAIEHVLGISRLEYVALMFGPLLLLPFVAKRGRYMMAYGLAATLLASRGAMHSVHFQYTTLIYPFAFALIPSAIARLASRFETPSHQRRRTLLAVGVLAGCLFSGLMFGALASNKNFQAGYSEFRPFRDEVLSREYRELVRLRELVPKDAAVATSRHVGPHLSNRWEIQGFPSGWGSEWLLLRHEDLVRKDPTSWRERNLELLRKTGAYRLVDEGHGLTLWHRDSTVDLPGRLLRPKQGSS